MTITRKNLEALVWRHTHRDFRGRTDGVRHVLTQNPTHGGTESWPLSAFTEEQLMTKLPRSEREQLEEKPETVTYTTAPKDYDSWGTHTVAVAGTTDNGKTVRKVASPPNYVEWQRDRYSSGLHMAVDETEWQKLVSYGLATPA